MAESEYKNRNNHEHIDAAARGPIGVVTAMDKDIIAAPAASEPKPTQAIPADGQHYFEGAEKSLEIWFKPSDDADLRSIPRSMWDGLLESVHCEIISYQYSDLVDAYVLSESSMFVSNRRWILKTCGTTTPLHCVDRMLRNVAPFAGYNRDDVQAVFYSHKNFKRPELQLAPYRAFDDELAVLSDLFDGGRSYCLGSPEDECWYVYTYTSKDMAGRDVVGLPNIGFQSTAGGGLTASDDGDENDSATCDESDGGTSDESDGGTADESSVCMSAAEDEDGERSCNSIDSGCSNAVFRVGRSDPLPDQTIEIMMTELDPAVMALFTKRECADAKTATERSGIDKLLPGMLIDDYLFEPCGYSMNGVGDSNGCYMTIHITPEPEFSYVSFESNVSASKYGDLIKRVIETFKPNKFVVTIFANRTSAASSSSRELDYADVIGSWKRKEIQFCRFPTYDLTYAHYCKFPS